WGGCSKIFQKSEKKSCKLLELFLIQCRKANLTKGETMIRTGLYTFGFLRMTLAACVGIPLIIASNAFAQNLAPAQTFIGAAPAPATAEAERVIVTGSNIPTAEEVGPNPVDTYNRDSIN